MRVIRFYEVPDTERARKPLRSRYDPYFDKLVAGKTLKAETSAPSKLQYFRAKFKQRYPDYQIRASRRVDHYIMWAWREA